MLERGVIVERGTHENLLVRRGSYWRLSETNDPRRLEGYRDVTALSDGGLVA
jgi:hypothetical protein